YSMAQFDPYSDEAKMLTTGIGVSGWGIPIFVRYEQGIAENITIGGTVSYQSKGYGSTGYKWRVSYFGISARGSYHFNELLDLNDSWDLYAGPSVGYYFGKFRTDDFVDGTANGGFGIGLHAGARYFINEKIAVNLDAGGGSLFGGVTIGATFIF
ncbi:MAG: outer membrane beta-barrel protein, partial [Candidatus Heimdallarchaeota archaeon]